MNGTPGPSRGLPILSGPPPITESDSCRQCAKDFNPLWRRSHTCGHCGYEYCSTCLSDGQALMPRRAGQGSLNKGPLAEIRQGLGLDSPGSGSGSASASNGSGYEVESVCVPCLAMLQVTCAPIESLRSLPLKRLKEYLAAYNIPNVGPKEKEDFVQAVVKARNPRTGSLSPEAEAYYRRNSVPKKSNSSNRAPAPPSSATARTQPQAQARPAQSSPSSRTQARPPPPRPPAQQAQRHAPPPPQSRAAPTPTQARPPPPRPQTQSQSQPSPRAPTHSQPARPAATPPPPVPTIMSLVALPNSYLSSLSIGTLKAILYENHVRVDFKQVLEKEELIARVAELVNAERRQLERQRYEEERQARGEATANGHHPEDPNGGVDGTGTGTDGDGEGEGEGEGVTDKRKVPTGPMPEIERGLCVICQDAEATLAVVDCGHLAMCQHCSELVMATSQECPLCRTRIVTSQRLIRIYRV